MTTDNKQNIEDIFELTPMQQGMLFHTLYNEGSDAYIEQFVLEFEGDMNKTGMKQAWRNTVLRHSALRASFRWKGITKPVQIIHKQAEAEWNDTDWSGLNADDQERLFRELRLEDRTKLFDLEKAPVMRFNMIDLGKGKNRLLWTFHHILMDGWSYPVIIGDVMRYYNAFISGSEARLGDAVQFKSFVTWLSAQDKAPAEKFWRSELAGFSSPSRIKGVAVRKDAKETIGSEEAVRFISEEGTSLLADFARRNQITVSTVIQAAWAYVLSAYSGETDVMFGGTVSGRPPELRDVERIVGLFINTQPVRVKIDVRADKKEWLKEIQNKYLEREQYSYASLADVQQWSGLPANTKLFDNILVFENYPSDPSLNEASSTLRLAGISAYEKTNFPLAFLAAPGARTKLTLAYDRNVYEPQLINSLLDSIEAVISSIVSDDTSTVGELSLLSPDKEQEILTGWNDTEHDVPETLTVKEMYEDLTSSFGKETAIEFGEASLSYEELNERSNKLANYLVSLGVEEDTFVGISIERSPDMIIALLAIFKAGAAYLPLDKSYPKERLEYMISDSGVKYILTKKSDKGELPDSGARMIYTDEDAEVIGAQNGSSPGIIPSPVSAAYMIFTSGSTGRPKGVIMHNLALVNLLNWQITGQKFGKGLRTLQFTTLSFDVAFQEIFSTLMTGGTLIVMTEDQRKDLSVVLNILREKKAERLFLPFIALQEIAELQPSSPGNRLFLKEVMTAGEQLQNTNAIKSLFKSLNNAVFTNQYGPTEAHVVTSYTLEGDPDTWQYSAPIGKPVFNTRIYILNSAMKAVPPGVTGELYIGGLQVARGYHNKSDLTAEKFLADLYGDESDRIYRTGDLARYMPDGNIEFLGRADNQIKYRGYRIELGEIESALNEIGKVSTSAVTARNAPNGEKRLAAYVVLKTDEKCDAAELKSALAERLPEFMLPADYVFLDVMPVLPSGKVDLRALPEPERQASSSAGGYVEPRDELELQLVSIWEKVLGVKNIGVKDDFFELGGHSLLALRLFGYIEKLTGKKLAISTLFAHPTIEQLAGILKTDGWKPPWKSLVAVKPGGSRLPFFCVPPGAGTAMHFQSLVKYVSKDQPFYVLESVGLDGKEPPHTNIEEMSAHYVKEIMTIQPEGPYLLGGRCFGGRVVFEMAQQFRKLGQEVALLAIFDTWPPFTDSQSAHLHDTGGNLLVKTFRHLRSGDLLRTARRYVEIKSGKFVWETQNKIKLLFSNKKKRLYNKIMLLHFTAQSNYVAKKYPGKITLIECSTFKPEFRKGWQDLAGGGFETHVVPDTDHKTIVREPKIREFAEKLNLVLEKTHAEIGRAGSSNGTAGERLPAAADEKAHA